MHYNGVELLLVFYSDTFKSTTNSDTIILSRVSKLVVLLNMSLRKMRKSSAPMSSLLSELCDGKWNSNFFQFRLHLRLHTYINAYPFLHSNVPHHVIVFFAEGSTFNCWGLKPAAAQCPTYHGPHFSNLKINCINIGK